MHLCFNHDTLINTINNFLIQISIIQVVPFFFLEVNNFHHLQTYDMVFRYRF